MNIIVCFKSVVVKPPQRPTGAHVSRTPDNLAANPFDLPALELALALRGKSGTVTVLSMGPQPAQWALYQALARGADRAVLLCDPALAGSDTLATSRALAAAVKKLSPCDLLLFGTRTADSDAGQVGPQTAAALDLPLVAWAREVEKNGDTLKVTRRADGYVEQFEVDLPAALTVHPEAFPDREADLFGLEKAFGQGTVEVLALSDLDLDSSEVGEANSPTRVLSMEKAAKKKKCDFMEGAEEEVAAQLVDILSQKGLL